MPLQIDHVKHPSWQAQLHGKKLWTLQPPPECLGVCRRMKTTVNPGEISEYQPAIRGEISERLPPIQGKLVSGYPTQGKLVSGYHQSRES